MMKRHVFLALLAIAALTSRAAAEDPVYFADAVLKAAVEGELRILDPNATDMLALTSLYRSGYLITDLTGLEYATNLTRLRLGSNSITDLSPLAGLASLTRLCLGSNSITDLSPLAGLTRLTWLELYDNRITDLSPLAGLTSLTQLEIYDNRITDLSPLAGLTHLSFLNLNSNAITDINPLSGLTELGCLYLQGNLLSRSAYCHDLQAIIDASPGVDSPYHNLQFDAPNPNPPGCVSASDGTYAEEVQITWDALCPGPGKSTTFQYMVYRSTSPGGVKDAISGWLSGTSFDDATASPWVHYCYWIKSNYSTGYSDPDEGWLAIRTLTVSSTAGGSVTTPGEGAFQYVLGTAAPVQATPDAHYHFVNWTGTAVDAGKVADPSSASTTVVMDADYTLQANFSIDRHTLTTSSNEGGAVTDPGEGATTYDYGTTVNLVATADAHYHFVSWAGTGVTAGKVTDPSSASTAVTMDADYTLQANFAINRYALTVSCGEGGSVETTIGLGGVWQTWIGDMSEGFNHGAEVTITATPEAGWHFTNWSGNLWSVDNPLRFTLTEERDLTANFAPDQRELVVTSGQGGAVVLPGEGSFAYTPGTVVPVVAVPDIGYRFACWTGTLVDSNDVADANASRTDVVVNQDGTLQANFAPPGTIIYVGQNPDPNSGPGDVSVSGLNEDGSREHPFGLIQQAIDAVGDGDAIFVLPGLYRENINFAGKRITVSSFDPDGFGAVSRTIIDGNGLGSVVTFEQNEDAGAVLAGFTILGGYAPQGGGIRCTGAGPTITNCLIVGNCADYGGGAHLSDSNAVLVNCTIADNYAVISGGALSSTGQVLLIDSIVWDHVSPGVDADPNGGLSVTYSDIQGSWPGAGNIDTDPLFALPGLLQITQPGGQAAWTNGDYHLKSAQGRWDPAETTWVQDALTSPCIDAGNLCARVKAEPAPNGGRINMGAFGGTAEASKSP